VNKVWILVVVLLAKAINGSAEAAPTCTQGEYYIKALGGYVLVPARFTPYSEDLQAGETGAYSSPPFPMIKACASERIAIEAGTIETGGVEAMTVPARLPRIAPKIRTTIGEFTITVWQFSLTNDSVKERTTALIVRDGYALRVFDADPELWRRIIDSFEQP
jgi:hypothetical protein